MADRFPDADVSEDQRYETRAVTWAWTSQGRERWVTGSIDHDRKAIYLKGDLDILCETAIAPLHSFHRVSTLSSPTTHRGSFSTCGEPSMLDGSLMP